MTFLRWVDAWWMQPLNAQPLALFRVLTGVFALVYIIWQWQYLTSAASFDASQYEPVGIATLLDQPLASWAALSLLWMSIVLGVAYTLGWRFSLTGPLFAILLLWVMTYRNSWGQIYHTENLLVLHVLVLGFTRSADTLSLDGRREARAPEAGLEYGWPLRLCALITVLSYFLAGWAKLNISGMAWITDDVLRNHIAYDIIRYELMGITKRRSDAGCCARSGSSRRLRLRRWLSNSARPWRCCAAESQRSGRLRSGSFIWACLPRCSSSSPIRWQGWRSCPCSPGMVNRSWLWFVERCRRSDPAYIHIRRFTRRSHRSEAANGTSSMSSRDYADN